MKTIEDLRTRPTHTVSRNLTEFFLPLDIDMKEFPGELGDWNIWSMVHRAQLFVLGCANDLTVMGEGEVTIGSSDFDAGGVSPQ